MSVRCLILTCSGCSTCYVRRSSCLSFGDVTEAFDTYMIHLARIDTLKTQVRWFSSSEILKAIYFLAKSPILDAIK